jgi:hypothetical protein
MTMATPLLRLLDDLRADGSQRAAFTDDPEGFLASHGWTDLHADELREALGFVRESLPIDVAVTIPDDPADLQDYVERTAPDLSVDDDFGADAVPHLDAELELEIELAGHLDEDVDAEPLTIDLGPDDGLIDVDDDPDDDDDL